MINGFQETISLNSIEFNSLLASAYLFDTSGLQKSAHFAKCEVGKIVLKALQKHQNHTVDYRRQGAEDDDGPRDLEHLGGHAGDETLWLCQVRHTLFSEKLRQPTFQWAAFVSGYCLD